MILVSGCAPSVIKLNTYMDDNPYTQYGKTSEREFHYDEAINLVLNEKWETTINGGFSNSSITAYDSVIFINDLSGRIYCFSIMSGKTLGQLKFKGSVFTTPIIHNSFIIFAIISNNENSSTLVYYDFKLGKEISSVEISGRVTVEMVKVDDGIILITETGQIIKFDFSAKQIWQYKTESFVHSSPASNSKYVVFGNDKGEIICIDVLSGNPVYRKKIAAPFFCGTVICENTVYIGNDDGNLYSIDLTSGNVNWAFQTNAKIKMEAVVSENEIYFGNLSGRFYKISRTDGTIIWETNTNGLLNVTPLRTKNVLIVPDANKNVHFISGDRGEIVNSLLIEGRAKLTPVIKNNLLFIGYENGKLRAYEINQ